MRYALTVFVCKTLTFLLKKMGRNATSAPGKIALKLYPGIGKKFAAKVKKEIIVTMGTNGKTTTNNLLADYLEAAGYSVVCNRLGANMTEGPVTAFLDKCSLFGKINVDFACLELDEAWANHVISSFVPKKIIITNLFRDQLDRYGEIEMTMEYIKRAVRKAENATLILNADDPISVAACEEFKNPKKYFGIKKPYGNYSSKVKDGQYCYKCGNNLQYNFYHFSQIGDYFCECGFKRPEIDFGAENISVFPKVSFEVEALGKIKLNGRGLYNIYNVLASSLGAYLAGIDAEYIRKCCEKYSPQVGRLEEFEIKGKKIYLVLAKNPAGFNQSVSTVTEDPGTKDLIVAVNDGAQDGTDISWLWDVDFEDLLKNNVTSYTVSGTRYADMALRLKYAGLSEKEIILSTDTRQRLEEILASGSGDSLYILANYTALLPIRKVLTELSEKYGKEGK